MTLLSSSTESAHSALGAASILSMGSDKPDSELWEEDVIGQALRQIVMHEMGHVLGLRHNFKGSLGVSYECTQNISCSAVYGLSSSVMDYLPMNYPAAGVDHVHAFSPVIGAYDKVAIRYGYMEAADQLPGSVLPMAPELQYVLVEAEAYPPCYDTDSSGEDPSCVAYDFTSDPLRYNREKLRRIADVQSNLLDTVMRPGASYKRFGESARELFIMAGNVALDGFSWVGGTRNIYLHQSMDGRQERRAARQAVPASEQREALTLLVRVLHPQKAGLLPPQKDFRYLIQGTFDDEVSSWNPEDEVIYVTSTLVARALDPIKIAQLHGQETFAAAVSPELPRFGVKDLLSGLVLDIIGDGQNISNPSEWNLQASLVKSLANLYVNGTALPESVSSQVLLQIGHIDALLADAYMKASGLVGANDDSKLLLLSHLSRLRQQFSDVFSDVVPRSAYNVSNELSKSGCYGPRPLALVFALAALALGRFLA